MESLRRSGETTDHSLPPPTGADRPEQRGEVNRVPRHHPSPGVPLEAEVREAGVGGEPQTPGLPAGLDDGRKPGLATGVPSEHLPRPEERHGSVLLQGAESAQAQCGDRRER